MTTKKSQLREKKEDRQITPASNLPYKDLFEKSPDAFLIIEGTNFTACNQATLDMLGYDTKDEIYNIHPSKLSPEYQPDGQLSEVKANQMISTALEKGDHCFEWIHQRKDGVNFPVEVQLISILHQNTQLIFVAWRDISERKQQEELLRRSQKMDALGKLTGGIAHDYNNILGIISGYTELLGEQLVGDPRMTKYIKDILHTADRGRKLTHKLLSFTRQKISEQSICDINTSLNNLHLMLEKTLTSSISLKYKLAESLWAVELDEGDLEDCIVNMSINAMHAMNNDGQLTISTSNKHLKYDDAKELGITPGNYVELCISDNGCGMSQATVDNIFDPFFSTKGEEGTGLGMSQVFGFMQRTGGKIKIFSAIDHGTRIVLLFPRSNEQVKLTPANNNNADDLTGDETILVVDDEISMGELAYEILSAKGYHVIVVDNAHQALSILDKSPVDLVITDVIMPEMDGYELASKIVEKYPQTKIQIISGFENNHYTTESHNKLRNNLIYKPYTLLKLLTNVRKLLNEKPVSQLATNRSILFMDDDEGICELFELKSRKLGYQLIIAHNSDEAISCYRKSLNNEKAIDIVILDLNTPNTMGGVDTARKIKELDPDARIIVSSANTECDEMKYFHRYGFNAALDKSSNTQTINDIFNKVL